MGLPTDSYIDIEIDEEVVDRIGLSAPLSDISEIISGGYCGMHHLLWRNGQTKTTDNDYTVSKTIPVELSGNTFPITVSEGHGDYNYPDGMFCGIVWLYSENSPMDYVINSSNIGDYKLVTEWDAPHYVYKPSPLQEAGHWTGITHLSWADNDMSDYVWNNGYNNNFMRLEYWDDNEGTNVVNVDQIRPYLMFQNENGKHFLSIYDYSYQATFFYADTDTYAATTKLKDYTDSENIAFCVAVKTLSDPNILPKTGSSYGMINNEGMSVNDQFGVYVLTSSSIIDGHSGYFAYGTEYAFHFKDDVFKDIAGCGLKFYTDKLYKPIISNGVVIGYTDDMDEESELDGWTGTTDHGIGPTPPPPPKPEGDDFDDHEMGAGSGISGMAQLWLLTKAQLDSLHSSFNSAPGGFDPMNSLISVMGLGVAPTYLFDEIEYLANINIRKSDGTSWSTGVEGHIVDSQKSAFQFTGITVDRKYNNFLDYSPYAIHEIFIPMCGWLTLPDIAVDRNITVTYLPDVESLKCRAVVSVVDNSGHRCVIGEKDGIMGADVPFTNTGHSLYVGEAIINGMNVAGEVITGAIGAGFTKTNAKGGTYRPYEGFTVGMGGTLPGAIGNALVSGQTNRTHYMTGNGTRIGFSDGENIQIKSTYHNIDKPTNYDHTVGKVCNKTGQLSSFHGFTVCDNPHIHISALEDEKSEIKALLEQGVILPSGE